MAVGGAAARRSGAGALARADRHDGRAVPRAAPRAALLAGLRPPDRRGGAAPPDLPARRPGRDARRRHRPGSHRCPPPG